MKQPTIKELKEIKACDDGIEWYRKNKKKTAIETINAANYEGLKYWNWYITKQMGKQLAVKYAIYAAEKVLHIYEEKYSNDDRPRKAIQAAKMYVNTFTEESIIKADVAERAAKAAWSAARAAAWSAAVEAAEATARAAARAAAWVATVEARAAVEAAWSASEAAAWSAAEATNGNVDVLRDIILYGINLIDGGSI